MFTMCHPRATVLSGVTRADIPRNFATTRDSGGKPCIDLVRATYRFRKPLLLRIGWHVIINMQQ